MTSYYVDGGFKYFFGIFTPEIGEDEPILTSIFFRWDGSTNNQNRNPFFLFGWVLVLRHPADWMKCTFFGLKRFKHITLSELLTGNCNYMAAVFCISFAQSITRCLLNVCRRGDNIEWLPFLSTQRLMKFKESFVIYLKLSPLPVVTTDIITSTFKYILLEVQRLVFEWIFLTLF